ncbi:TPA: efflux RND transporter periplasmic adaptor subunit [Vibrio cholerae]|nr:efflux RND transporter periplasmic adaptor subunit [Vibrio cholerae]GHY04024.1 periplasmic linker protein, putative [Vibrio cholerae]HDZ9128409.1 efflux RND transporter periplasmic adaptor subunit [Vibrio cholerae]
MTRPFIRSVITKRTLLSVVVGSALLLTGCGEAPQVSTPAPIIKPALTEIVASQRASDLTFNGVVRAAQRADLAFRISGRLTDIAVKEGDQVKKGQLLASLDSRDAKTALEAAQLELKNTEQEYSRSKAIFEKTQAISKAELDKVTNRYDLAKNRVEEAKRKLEYTQITAPFDGVISEKTIENFAQVQANQVIMILQDLNDLEVAIEIPHRVMLSGVRNTRAIAELSAIPNQQFDLKLRTYSTQPSSDSQTYSVVLGFEDLKGFRVMPGMSAKVIPVADNPTAENTLITLPLTALVPDNQGKQFVWVVNAQDQAEKRYVDIGTTYKDRVVITQHLKPGEQVIIAGVSSVREGMTVRPYTDNNGAQ